jgi:hypothetical protein
MDCGDFMAIRMFARRLVRTCLLPVDLKVNDSSTPAALALPYAWHECHIDFDLNSVSVTDRWRPRLKSPTAPTNDARM